MASPGAPLRLVPGLVRLYSRAEFGFGLVEMEFPAGVPVDEALVHIDNALSQVMREGLYRFECERLALNLQMSVVHSLYRQAATCAIKMASAERLLRQFTTAVEVSR